MSRASILFFFLILLNIQISIGQIVSIPDPNFKTALLNHNPVIDSNSDGEIQVSEALTTTAISAFNQNISSIVGIEAFINLERLVCFNNPIASVDLSSNTQLEQINLQFTDLSEIDISANLELSFISLGYTSISDIDVTQHSNLEFLDISGTNINTIDVTNNLNLLALSIINLTSINNNLDLSNNILLESIEMRNIGIDNFDFSLFLNLKIVDIGFNNFSDVDFSNNNQLCSLKSRNCPVLNTINIQNGNNQALAPNQNCSVDFTIGGLSSVSGIDAFFGSLNLDLICVDDIEFANDNFTLIPAQTQFVEDCSVLSIDSFLIENIVLKFNPVKENLILESKHNIKNIDVFAVTGEKVIQKEINNREVNVNVENLTPGVYFISLTTVDSRTKTLKFLKL
ncbi:T9SS type A sorting domain-containing protein [Psychroserpens ponticola]|uniref:T9SS type A sorting domain-containing protein n=1 Tax=Psychroserpens ponticola TaxID=2932268 RepID=A0ABY7RWB5_9FLAO|nr:T9SS type A sorting domain-containing protein [Psychroserpens ponticola]WCO01439.1 T9SS type A sorting domain-containing protein [Psychroserpens ponticola]